MNLNLYTFFAALAAFEQPWNKPVRRITLFLNVFFHQTSTPVAKTAMKPILDTDPSATLQKRMKKTFPTTTFCLPVFLASPSASSDKCKASATYGELCFLTLQEL